MKLSTVLVAGTLLRETFSFWTGHPFDFELWVRLGYFTYRGVSPYGVLPPAPGLSFANVFSQSSTATVGYFPLWPMVTAAVYGLYATVGFGNPFVYYFLLKQPVILGDMALAYLLYLFVKKERPERALWVAKVWTFFPFTIIVSALWGTFDALAMALVMAAMLSASYSRRSVLSGLATLAKSIPIIYAIPLTVASERRWWGLVVAILLPIGVTLVTAILLGWPIGQVGKTLGSTVVKGGESMSILELLEYLSYLGVLTVRATQQLWLLGYLWIPAVAIGTLLAMRAFGLRGERSLIQTMLVATLLFLIFKAQVNEQYAIYLLALGLLDVSLMEPGRTRLLVVTAVVATAYLAVNNLLLVRFLAPAFPQATVLDSSLDQTYDFYRNTLKLVLGAAFTALNLLYLASIWPRGSLSLRARGRRPGSARSCVGPARS